MVVCVQTHGVPRGSKQSRPKHREWIRPCTKKSSHMANNGWDAWLRIPLYFAGKSNFCDSDSFWNFHQGTLPQRLPEMGVNLPVSCGPNTLYCWLLKFPAAKQFIVPDFSFCLLRSLCVGAVGIPCLGDHVRWSFRSIVYGRMLFPCCCAHVQVASWETWQQRSGNMWECMLKRAVLSSQMFTILKAYRLWVSH